MDRDTTPHTLRHHLRTVAALEALIAVFVIAVLNGLAVRSGKVAYDRAYLTEQLVDLTTRRQYVAEQLAITGLLPNEPLAPAHYTFDHVRPSRDVVSSASRRGFRELQQEIEQKILLSPITQDDATSGRDSTMSKGRRQRAPGGGIREYGQTSSVDARELSAGSLNYDQLVFGKDFRLIEGSTYYLLDNLISVDSPGIKILGFALNSHEPFKYHSFWYQCDVSSGTSRGPHLTSPVFLGFGSMCRIHVSRP